MGWLSQFLLGRPGFEYAFDINPEAMDIDETGVFVLQRNLAGDLKKSVIKVSAPIIRINSSYLAFAQRNQFASLVGITDTFLSFQTRDDWEMLDQLCTTISLTSIRLPNSSALRLSALLAYYSLPSVITIETPFKLGAAPGVLFGEGGFGDEGFGSGEEDFDPGTVTYDDQTRVISFTNPLPDTETGVFVSYLYTGWLVNLDRLGNRVQGGWIDKFTYDFTLTGA